MAPKRPAPAGPSQPRRSRRDTTESTDDDSEHVEGAIQAQEGGGETNVSFFDHHGSALTRQMQVETKATQLVRFALFCEYRRKTMSRTDITKESMYHTPISSQSITLG
jgi:hypothetical protein